MLRYLILFVVTLAVGMAAITTQSFWIDEGATIYRAMMPGLGYWWKMLFLMEGSDVQMPVYMFYAWFWHQHFGAVTEYALRMSNLPWLVLAVLVLARVRFWPLVCLLSPFVLYFVNDFRPYTMQIAAGACAAAALGRAARADFEEPCKGVHAICAACLFLILCSLTGAVWAACVALGAVVMNPDWLRNRGFWLRAAPWIAAALAAGAYYAYTLMVGYRAVGTPDAGILNVLFGIYEMTGLLGLGPGKEELRRGLSNILPYLWILIPAALVICATWCFGFAAWARKSPPKVVIGVACAVVLPILILTIVGLVMEFRVVGRHLSPAIPAVLLPLAHAFEVTGRMRKTSLALAAVTCLLMLVSSLNIRFTERHAKDDFRQATHLAIEALKSGKRVLWQADMSTPRYYAYRQGGVPMMHSIQVLQADRPSSLMFADMVFINRPDLRFRDADYRARLGYDFFKLEHRFPGFEVWVPK